MQWHGDATLSLGEMSVDVAASIVGQVPTDPNDGLGVWSGTFNTPDSNVYRLLSKDGVTITLRDGRQGYVVVTHMQTGNRGFLGRMSGSGEWPA